MATLTVTTAADMVDAGDGQLSLREAVQQANATGTADTIVFANALEGWTLTLTQGQLTLSEDVALDGDRDDNGLGITLDGNRNGRVLEMAANGTDVRLADLAVIHGRVTDLGNGGGIDVAVGASLVLTRCRIEENEAQGGNGGGLHIAGGGVHLVECVVSGNLAAAGGGISGSQGADIAVRGSEVLRNGSIYGSGGGFFVTGDSSLAIETSTLSGNGARTRPYDGTGGAILLQDSRADIARSAIERNVADVGGGIFADSAMVTVIASTLAGNMAWGMRAGGALYAQESLCRPGEQHSDRQSRRGPVCLRVPYGWAQRRRSEPAGARQ